jgi:hypothetical protein
MVFKKKKTTTRRRTTAKVRAVSRRRKISRAFKPLNHMLAGATYGFMRGQLNDVVSNSIASKIPAGQFADELAFSGISYLLATKGKKIMGVDLKQVGKAGLQVEGALIGNQLSENMPLNLNLGGLFGNMSVSPQTVKKVGYAS